MATIQNPEIIRTLLKNDGRYPSVPDDDPQAARIYAYTHIPTAKPLFAVFYAPEHDDIQDSPYVQNPKLLWSSTSGLTANGRSFLYPIAKS